MGTMKSRTNVLPAGSDQHVALQIKHGCDLPCHCGEVLHQCAERRHIENVGQFLIGDFRFWTENSLEFQPQALFALTQRLFGEFLFRDIYDIADDTDNLAVCPLCLAHRTYPSAFALGVGKGELQVVRLALLQCLFEGVCNCCLIRRRVKRDVVADCRGIIG